MTITVTGSSGPFVNVEVVETTPILVTALVQGPAGPPGGSSTGITLTAGEDLGGHRVISVNNAGLAVYAQDIYGIGLTMNAVSIGNTVTIHTSGEVVEPSWAWTPGLPIYQVGIGQLTQSIPVAGFLRQVGMAIAPTKLTLTLNPPITLG